MFERGCGKIRRHYRSFRCLSDTMHINRNAMAFVYSPTVYPLII
uniref:Uncharacterized protein n=1 Tax=Anguilla anguilla TaxID=7936 RepID=A0A0E9TZF3_ANGAN